MKRYYILCWHYNLYTRYIVNEKDSCDDICDAKRFLTELEAAIHLRTWFSDKDRITSIVAEIKSIYIKNPNP